MRVTIRTDASLEIGTGHVMRCLTLARALRDANVECRFICREHPGNMLAHIREQGFEAFGLPMPKTQLLGVELAPSYLAHAAWLGCHWVEDADQTKVDAGETVTDWLIVDHYALDACWEEALRPTYQRLLVIDDLADRRHVCNVLLDQNLIEDMRDRYQDRVPSNCICLLGPQYALLRPEFRQLRPTSLARRGTPKLDRLLVFLGGSDVENETCKVIRGIQLSKRNWRRIDVVVGQSYPAVDDLRKELANLPSAVLHIQTSEMAQLMQEADLAITAGGSVTWEKCALGLPSLVVIQGDNQYPIATKMHEVGAQLTLGRADELTPVIYANHLDSIQIKDLTLMSETAQAVCDGSGIDSILHVMGIAA